MIARKTRKSKGKRETNHQKKKEWVDRIIDQLKAAERCGEIPKDQKETENNMTKQKTDMKDQRKRETSNQSEGMEGGKHLTDL